MLYVIVSMLFFFLQNAVNKAFGNHYRADTRLLMLYQLPVHLTMLACLLLMGARLNLPVGGWLLAIGYGMIFLSTITLMTKSLSVGPIGQTTLIVNLSLLLSLIAGVAFFGERMTVCRWLGIPCILLTLILSALGRGDDKKKSGRWLALVLVTMLGDGSLSLVQKTFVTLYPEAEVSSFILASVLAGTAISGAIVLQSACAGKLALPQEKLRFFLYAVLVGAGTVFGTLYSMKALTVLDGVVVFPVRQGGLIVLITIYGVLRYKDKFDLRIATMLASGLLGIVLLNL